MSGAKSSSAVSSAGYSGKPLWQKLGLKPGLRIRLHQTPAEYWDWCDFDASSVTLILKKSQAFDFGHLFATSRADLDRNLAIFAKSLDKNGMLWISWPKKSSGVVSDITENTLRDGILPLGLVDVKVCAVSAVWSGLKFVWRREHR